MGDHLTLFVTLGIIILLTVANEYRHWKNRTGGYGDH